MSRWQIVLRSLRHYWRTNLFIVLGVMVATGVMTGSLLVGDSMQSSLRESVLARLGDIDCVMITPHFFPATLGDRMAETPELKGMVRYAAGIFTRGGARRADEADKDISRVTVMGVDEQYWKLFAGKVNLKGNEAAVNRELAEDLHLAVGQELVVSVDRGGMVTDEVLFAHRKRDETLRILRVTVAAIVGDKEGGGFGFEAGAVGGTSPRNVFLSRETLAGTMEQPGKANVLLAGKTAAGKEVAAAELQQSLEKCAGLADYGLTLVTNEEGHYVGLESRALLMTDAQVEAAKKAAADAGGTAAPTSVYLATRVAKPDGKEIAYAIVSNVPEGIDWKMAEGADKDLSATGMVLNSWAAGDMGAKVGDAVELTYLTPTREGEYVETKIPLKVVGIVELSGAAADRHMTPGLNGLTDAKRIDEWKLPFPVDHKLLTDRDEEYWDQYGATPKAFVSSEVMRGIWQHATGMKEAGWVTGVRLVPPAGMDLPEFEKKVAEALVKCWSQEKNQMVFRGVREQMLAAATGSTDFGELFLSMSFFLVVAAGAMSGTLMRLLVEQRAGEIGLLLACGWRRGRIMRLFLLEGLLLTLKGVVLGVALGVVYEWGILQAMDRWWMGPWGRPVLDVHVSWQTLLIGGASGLLLGIMCVLWGVRAVSGKSLLRLLSGRQAVVMIKSGMGRVAMAVAVLLMVSAAALIIAAGNKLMPPEMGFFAGGSALLAALLTGVSAILGIILSRKGDVISLTSLAVRNAAANRRRSMLTIGLLACASFILVAVGANRRNYSTLDTSDPQSGTGGFVVRATTSVPLHYDLDSPAARKSLGFTAEEEKAFANVKCVSLTESAGDDVSCLNLAKPLRPRLLGVKPKEMPTLAGANLLEGQDAEGAIPAIGDADSVQWILQCNVGEIYTFDGPDGKPVKLRIVGVIPGSIYAGDLLVSEENLRRIYPKLSGRNYFLFSMAGGAQRQRALMDALRSGLADEGVEVRTTREILNRYVGVQNVYMSIFLSLGGLGLLLGTAGLVAVIARSVLERRGELALMAATGFKRSRLVRLIALEHGGLLAGGLLCGAVAAVVSVQPALASGLADVPWAMLAGMLVAVAVVGLAACIITARGSIGKNPMRALHEE